jgi:hypothetical protein
MASKPNLGVVIASVLSLLALCGLAWGADSNGLISHWEFDEGMGTTAYDSAGDNDGMHLILTVMAIASTLGISTNSNSAMLISP